MSGRKVTVLTTDRETDLCMDCREHVAARCLLHRDGTPPWPR